SFTLLPPNTEIDLKKFLTPLPASTLHQDILVWIATLTPPFTTIPTFQLLHKRIPTDTYETSPYPRSAPPPCRLATYRTGSGPASSPATPPVVPSLLGPGRI